METGFYMRSVPKCYNRDKSVVRSSVLRWWPAGNAVSKEAEKSSLLEAVISKRLVESVTD
jgi:hypothetical protein